MNTGNTLLGKTDHREKRSRARFWTIVLLIVMIAVAAIGILIRWSSHQALKTRTDEESILTVSVIKPSEGPATDELDLPGTMNAFQDAPIYARTDGYLKAWYFDIGARVKKGDLLAVIETPEVDEQLEQATAAVGTARANYELAQVTNRRYQVLVKTNAVSRQEADQYASNEAALKASLDAAIANEHHYAALQSFQKIYAPFDGVVTARYTDIGQLVSAGIGASAGSGSSGTSAHELFRVASLDRLRTFIPVPQGQSVDIRDGQSADITLVEYPGRKFTGHVARTSRSIDVASRTLLTEVDIDNPRGELRPGSYVTVHLTVPGNHSTVRAPINTLIFRSHGMQVAIVGPDNLVHLRNVEIGRDFGTQVELVDGATAGDDVVLNPPDSLMDGQKVRIGKQPTAGATGAQGGEGPEKQKQGQAGEGDSGPKDDGKDQKKSASRASNGPGEAPEKQSTKPDKGGDTQDKTGDQPDSGMTAPGSDGNAQK